MKFKVLSHENGVMKVELSNNEGISIVDSRVEYKNFFDEYRDCKAIEIVVDEYMSNFTSGFIGYLLKVINLYGVNLSISTYSNDLYTILDDLNLIGTFNVKDLSNKE